MNNPIVFAHRGAPVLRADANTIGAFQHALSLGATGLESDIGVTADGVPVLAHVSLGIGRKPAIAQTLRVHLPHTIPSLEDVYGQCGTNFELSLDMAQPRAVDAVVRIADRYGATDRLWLTYWRRPELRRWRERWPHIHLVYPSIPLRRQSVIRLMDDLADDRVDVLNLHYRICRPWMSAEATRRGLRLFAWGLRSPRSVDRMVRYGVHGLYCDNLDQLLPRMNGSLTG